MRVRFIAEIVDDERTEKKAPVSVEVDVPDIAEYSSPSAFYKVFDRYERPVIEARNQIAAEITKEYLGRSRFFKMREKAAKRLRLREKLGVFL